MPFKRVAMNEPQPSQSIILGMHKYFFTRLDNQKVQKWNKHI